MKKFKLKTNKSGFLSNFVRGISNKSISASVSSLLLHSINSKILSFVSHDIHTILQSKISICSYISQSIILSNRSK